MDFVGWENVPSYSEVKNLSLWLQTDDEQYVADAVEVVIEAYLVEYPTVTMQSIFCTAVTTCEVTVLTAVATDDQEYVIYTPSEAATINPNPFIIEPACAKGIEYSI